MIHSHLLPRASDRWAALRPIGRATPPARASATLAVLSSYGAVIALAASLVSCAGTVPTAPAGPAASAPPQPSAARASAAAMQNAVIERQPWSFGGLPGRVLRSRHFDLFTTDDKTGLADRLPGFAEAALDFYTRAIVTLPAPEASQRFEVYFMASRDQWEKLTLLTLGDRGSDLLFIGRGGFATGGRGYYYALDASDTYSLAAHEGWHQFTQRTFAQPLPIWLEEGIATYMEGFRWRSTAASNASGAGAVSLAGVGGAAGGGGPVVGAVEFLPWANLERFDRLREDLARGKGLSLLQVVDSSPTQLLQRGGDAPITWYAHVWALTHFLAEGESGRHRAALESMILDASSGALAAGAAARLQLPRPIPAPALRSGPTLFRAYFGDPAALDREYQAFIRQIVRTGSRQRIVDGRSPIDPASPAQ